MLSFDQGYALIVGIANYPKVRPLPATVLQDATDLTTLLTDRGRCGYQPDQVRLLLDEQATGKNIREGLRWLAQRVGPDDTAIFFFSGHGGRINHGSLAGNYLIPFDTDLADLRHTALPSEELTELLKAVRAGRLVALFDCCHAGGTGEVKQSFNGLMPGFKSGLDEQYFDRLATGHGRVIIASSRSNELSWILPGMQNSLFTHYLLEALRGQARPCDNGLIRVLDVFNFVATEIPKREPNQHPILKAELETNFPIAMYLGGKQSGYTPHLHSSPQPQTTFQETGLINRDVKQLRACLAEAFSDTVELRLFCQDYFKKVYRNLSEIDRFDVIIGKIIAYCESRGDLDLLWGWIAQERPKIYERYKMYQS